LALLHELASTDENSTVRAAALRAIAGSRPGDPNTLAILQEAISRSRV
jgi:hypothetical protein